MRPWLPYLASFLVGCVWAGIAYLIAYSIGEDSMWAGVLSAPFIGMLAGATSKRFSKFGPMGRYVFNLIILYAAVGLFGLALGISDLATGIKYGWNQIPYATVVGPIFGCLWGITFTGFLWLLWPLSYASHSVIARLWARVDA